MAKKEKQKKELTTTQRLSSIIKSCRDIMRKDKGLNGDADRLPMLTWLMFLKFLDDMEKIDETKAEMEDRKYVQVIEEPYRWRDWATNDGFSGDDLILFINAQECILPNGQEGAGLFHYLRQLQSENGRNRKDVVATVFRGVINRMVNGYLLKNVIEKINEVNFTSTEEIHTLSHLYESMLKEMRDASGDGGEFYTPRPVIKFIVDVIDPKLGETILDPAAGTGGFLVEAFEHLKKQTKSVEDRKILQESSIFGGEAKSLPYLLCQMNLLFHGMEFPVIDSDNSLRFKINEIGDSQRVDIIITNPPFGGEEEKGILKNFPDDKQTSETALLFLQLIMRKLKRKKVQSKGGRAAVVVPNGTLFGDGVSARIKKHLIENFNLHTIVRLPEGVFAPYTGIPTNILFFDARKTEDIWYYEVQLPEGRKNYTKTKPMQIQEFEPCKKWWYKRKENEYAWKVSAKDIVKLDKEGNLVSVNLDMKNPNKKDEFVYIEPAKLIDSIVEKEKRILELMEEIKSYVG
jgi:type I restriction enzyme M protein